MNVSTDLSASGYTPQRQVVLSVKVIYNMCVRMPTARLLEESSRLVGISNLAFARRWDEIPLPPAFKSKLYLGGLPVINKILGFNDISYLTDKTGPNIGAVLCLTQGFENHYNGYIYRAVTPEDWRKQGVEFLQLETPDHGAVSLTDIERGILFINKHLVRGNNVFVHCQAGMSRSATLVVSYLLTFFREDFPTLEIAFKHIQSHRPQVWIEPPQVQSVDKYLNTIRANELLTL